MQKGPYFQPVQYISPLPEGYLRASENIANTMGKAAQGLGQSIASSIEQYTKNKEEGQFLDEKFQMTTGNLEKYKTDPKYAEDPRAKKLAEGVGKFSAMSNSQKKSFLNNADFAVSQFDREAAIDYKKLQDQRQYELDAQKALIDAATFRSNEAVNAAKIEEMRQTFSPSGRTVTLEDGTVVPLVSIGKNQFQVVSKSAAPKPQSPAAQLLADLTDAKNRNDPVATKYLQNQVDALENKAKGTGASELTPADQQFIQNTKEYFNQIGELQGTVKDYGTFESSVFTSDPKQIAATSNLKQLPYKSAIAYTKIVDPGSVAMMGEVEAAKKYVIPLGLTENRAVALQSIENQKNEVKRRAAEFAKIKGIKYEDYFNFEKDIETPTPVSGKSPSGVDYTVIRNPKKRS